MFTREYFVIRRQDGWWVRSVDGNVGPYTVREAAKQDAIAAAQKDYRNKGSAKVFLEKR